MPRPILESDLSRGTNIFSSEYYLGERVGARGREEEREREREREKREEREREKFPAMRRYPPKRRFLARTEIKEILAPPCSRWERRERDLDLDFICRGNDCARA